MWYIDDVCPVCRDVVGSVRIGFEPCCHTVCGKCTLAMLGQRHLQCPLCRSTAETLQVVDTPEPFSLANNMDRITYLLAANIMLGELKAGVPAAVSPPTPTWFMALSFVCMAVGAVHLTCWLGRATLHLFQ